jgi:hypothetical protein
VGALIVGFVSAALAQSVEIAVSDPLVRSVRLECATGSYDLPVRDGKVAMERVPEHCQLFMERKSGVVNQPGKWVCTLDTCQMTDVEHAAVADAPGRVNIILTSVMASSASLELTCPGGYKVRSDIRTNTAIFEGVQSSECTLWFKGTVPAKFQPMSAGTWSCGLSNTIAVCTRR